MPTHTLEQFRAARISGEAADAKIVEVLGEGYRNDPDETFHVYPLNPNAFLVIAELNGAFEVEAWGELEVFDTLTEAESYLYRRAHEEGALETPAEQLRTFYRENGCQEMSL